MEITSVRVKEDLKMRLNRLKYQFGYSNIDQLIRRLIELATPQLNNANAPSKEPGVKDSLKKGEAGGIDQNGNSTKN